MAQRRLAAAWLLVYTVSASIDLRYKVVQMVPKNEQQLHHLQRIFDLSADLRLNFWRAPSRVNNTVDVMMLSSQTSNSTFIQLLHDHNITYQTVIEDVARLIEKHELKQRAPSGRRLREEGKRNRAELPMAQYHSYARIVQWLNNIQQQYPSIARVVNIGRTVQGRDILGIKLGNPVHNQNKRIVWIDAGIHAREWASIHTALYFINELITGYGSGDREIIRYLDTLNFYIFPCLNPDGYEFTLANPANPEIRLWRKNRAEARCAQNSFGHTRCCQGVDLNRNFDFHFGESGSSAHPCADTYRGETAFSEPESKAVRNFVFSAELFGKIDAFITLHTYSQLWIYSYSHRKFSFPTDVEDMKSLAKKAVNALEKMYGTRYDVGAGPDVIYAFSGGSTDWAKESAKVKFSYTIELRPSYHDFNGFILDRSQLIPTARETWAGLKVVVDRVLEDANTKRAGWSQ